VGGRRKDEVMNLRNSAVAECVGVMGGGGEGRGGETVGGGGSK